MLAPLILCPSKEPQRGLRVWCSLCNVSLTMIRVTTLIGAEPVHDASVTWEGGAVCVRARVPPGDEGCAVVASTVGDAVRMSLPPSTTAPMPSQVEVRIVAGDTYILTSPPTSDGGAFLEVIARDLHDIVVREIMRVPGVKSADVWRLSLTNRFTATHLNDRRHILAKCACVASFCPTLLAYLGFFRSNLHFANRGVEADVVRCGRVIYTLQRNARAKGCKAGPRLQNVVSSSCNGGEPARGGASGRLRCRPELEPPGLE